MKLFEYKNRSHEKPATHNENTYDYYDRSARKDVSKVRDVLNIWFENYPDKEKLELRGRFKKTFSSAFYELFIFNLFKNQGFDILIHPKVPNSSKRPDFLLSKNGVEFYLEAKVATGESEEQESYKNRINQIYDSLNTIKSPNFFFRIEELVLKTKLQPSTKQIRNTIECELTNFDADEVTRLIKTYELDSSPRISVEDNNLKLVISLIPKDPEYRNLDGRPVGVYLHDAYMGGEEESIKTSFKKKARRYGKLDKPYVVCINSVGKKFSGDFDVMNAVWGTEALSWTDDPNNDDEKLVRLRDGLIMGENGPIYQNVSGILITSVMEFNLAVSPHWLIKHPFAHKDLDFELFEMTYQYRDKNNIETVDGKSISEILNIKSNWLNEK
ncbi:MAG: hypothetical protein JXR34_13810 [Bacteroidales bacterium]|nr:hypothetical protein [Bacteroidales bacterium]